MHRKVLLSCLALLLALSFLPGRAEAVTDGDKVLVVMVYDGGCHMWCDEVRPIISGVTKTYGDKVVLYELDVQKTALQGSLAKADDLGVKSFVEGALSWVPTIGVFTQKRKLVRSVQGVGKKDTYKKCIDKALKTG